jgi:predicted transcriptional regulator
MKKKIKPIQISFMILLVPTIVFGTCSFYQAFHVSPSPNDTVYVYVISPRDSITDEIKCKIQLLEGEINKLKEKKSKLIINCYSADSTIQYKD